MRVSAHDATARLILKEIAGSVTNSAELPAETLSNEVLVNLTKAALASRNANTAAFALRYSELLSRKLAATFDSKPGNSFSMTAALPEPLYVERARVSYDSVAWMLANIQDSPDDLLSRRNARHSVCHPADRSPLLKSTADAHSAGLDLRATFSRIDF